MHGLPIEGRGPAVAVQRGAVPRQELGDDVDDPVGMGRAAGDVDGGLAGDGLDAFHSGRVGARGGDAAERGAGADAENLGRLGREVRHRLLEGDILPVIGPGPAGPAAEGGGDAALHGQDIAAGPGRPVPPPRRRTGRPRP